MKNFLVLLSVVVLLGVETGFAGFRGSLDLNHEPSSPPKKTRPEEGQQFAFLRKYLDEQKLNTTEKAQNWAQRIIQAIEAGDPRVLRKVIEDLLIEDQMFLDPEEEQKAFGKKLKDFSSAEKKDILIKYTLGQKEIRNKLLTEVTQLVNANGKSGSKRVAQSLGDIKKDHLDAYDRVLQELKAGNLDTSTTHCFTCGEGEPIGKTGYTFGGAMREAASRVVAAFAEQMPAQVKPKTVEQAPKKAIQPATLKNPVMKGSRVTAKGRSDFEDHLKILQSDRSLSDATLRKFLKSGYYGRNNSGYREKINRLSREQLLKAVEIFFNGEGPYNHCPSCNLGAGNRLPF